MAESSDPTLPGSSPTTGREPPPEVLKAPPGDRFGRYVRIARLGGGGMGDVWRAYDVELARPVALKFLKGSDEEEIERFVREARMAGGLHHPNIAAIYEAGEARGERYIAMQLVAGTTLRAHVGRGDRRAAELIRDAARAVHYAHGHGIIHRDLKPENLMVEPSGRLYVMDFGLAKSVTAGASLSRTGMVVGTPAYMAPEQARGERVDERADIYALGATLYELLSERAPFAGSNVLDILVLVATEDAPPLRGELGAVVGKAMAREPRGRYLTAEALADDLDRWLRGDPVLARPPGLGVRLTRWAAKRKAMTIAVGVGVVALLGAMALWPLLKSMERTVSQEQAGALERVRATAKTCTEGVLELRRGGAMRGMERLVGPFEEAFAKAPRSAETLFLRGRLMRALMRNDEALAMQNESLKVDPAYASSLYERAVLRSYEYTVVRRRAIAKWKRSEGRRIQGNPDARYREPKVDQLEKLDASLSVVRGAIVDDIKRLQALNDPGVGEARLLAARGLLGVLDGDRDGHRLLREAVARDPLLEEAFAALSEFGYTPEKIEWCTKGLEHDKGYIPHLLGRGDALELTGTVEQTRGGDPTSLYDLAIADFDRILEAVPDHVDALCGRARTRMGASVFAVQRGRDPLPSHELAVKDVERAIALSPGRADLHQQKGSILLNRAAGEGERGKDVRELLREAVREFDQAILIEGQRSRTWESRAQAYFNLAIYQATVGGDPQEASSLAEADLRKALDCDPSDREAWTSIGSLHLRMARWTLDEAKAAALFELASREFDRSLELSEGDAEALKGRADVRTGQGDREMVAAAIRPSTTKRPALRSRRPRSGSLTTRRFSICGRGWRSIAGSTRTVRAGRRWSGTAPRWPTRRPR